jgi:hypothetical protein
MPTSAISAATTAVATPPDHSGLASTWREDLGPGSGLSIGIVICSPHVEQRVLK